MSKMGNQAIREAETRSLDNAGEIERLRAEVAYLEAEAIRLDRACRAIIDALSHHHDGGREPFPADERYAEAYQGLYDALDESERGFGGRRRGPGVGP
jgi:hypothetical protein